MPRPRHDREFTGSIITEFIIPEASKNIQIQNIVIAL